MPPLSSLALALGVARLAACQARIAERIGAGLQRHRAQIYPPRFGLAEEGASPFHFFGEDFLTFVGMLERASRD